MPWEKNGTSPLGSSAGGSGKMMLKADKHMAF